MAEPGAHLSGLHAHLPLVSSPGTLLSRTVFLCSATARVGLTALLLPQVLHKKRSKYNVRNGYDLAMFLADPRQEDFVEHFESLQRLELDRGYHRVLPHPPTRPVLYQLLTLAIQPPPPHLISNQCSCSTHSEAVKLLWTDEAFSPTHCGLTAVCMLIALDLHSAHPVARRVFS